MKSDKTNQSKNELIPVETLFGAALAAIFLVFLFVIFLYFYTRETTGS